MSTDAVLLDRALRAIRGLIEIGEHRGVKPSDITLTIISDIERRLATPTAPVAPIRAYRLTLKLDADTLPELASALMNLSLRADRGELTRGVCGGPDSGYIYELLINPAQTHETYFNQVREYLARKKAEQKRTCDEGCNGCDDCTDYEDDIIVCERCNGDGTDPMCDNLLPCPLCQGEQQA